MRANRRHRHEEEVNHDRWLISYADFITLLFAFFVVLYSVSSVNEGKYRVLSDALEAAFRAPASSLNPVNVGRSGQPSAFDPSNTAMIKLPRIPLAHLLHEKEQQVDINNIAEKIENALESLIEQELVSVKKEGLSLEIELKSRILFASGSAVLARSAEPVLVKLADIIRGFDYPVRVAGHTDNMPISTRQFPTNWELSTARASSVVRLIVNAGIDPLQLAASGYGEFRPIANNDTAQGRADNRRVVIVVDAGATVEPDTTTTNSFELLGDF